MTHKKIIERFLNGIYFLQGENINQNEVLTIKEAKRLQFTYEDIIHKRLNFVIRRHFNGKNSVKIEVSWLSLFQTI